jgi:hypothetical protein
MTVPSIVFTLYVRQMSREDDHTRKSGVGNDLETLRYRDNPTKKSTNATENKLR